MIFHGLSEFLWEPRGKYHNIKISVNNQIIGYAITQCVLDEATLFNIAIPLITKGRLWPFVARTAHRRTCKERHSHVMARSEGIKCICFASIR